MVSVFSGVSGTLGTSGMESEKAGVVSAGVGMVSVLSGVSGNSGTSGTSGVYKVKVLGKKPASGAAPNNYRRELEMMFRQSMGVLIDKTDIVDNRSVFY